jgi:hypothetical protein
MSGFPTKLLICLAVMILPSRMISAGECQNVPLISQSQSYWCWAASDQMVRQYWNPAGSAGQCDDANYAGSVGACRIPGGNVCCGSPSSCNQTCTPQIQHDFPSTLVRYGRLSPNEVNVQMGSPCSPFIFLYLLPGGVPHWRVARGYLNTLWGDFIHVNDPNPLLQDQTYILYNDYAANSTQSWYRIRP